MTRAYYVVMTYDRRTEKKNEGLVHALDMRNIEGSMHAVMEPFD